MNKKLLAVAIAGVLAAPLAQAQTANVTLYGRLNLNSQVIINAKQDTGVKQNLYQVNSNSSRLGVRGTESLGGGLNAIFQAEERFDASNAGAVSLAGDSFVGLQGAWGTGKIGYFLTPYDDVGAVFGSVPTLITGILGSQSLWSNSGYVGNSIDTGAFDDRAANSLRYDSPNIAGFTFAGQVAGSRHRRHGRRRSGAATPARVRHVVRQHVQQRPVRRGDRVRSPQQPARAARSARAPKLQDQGITLAGSYTWGAWKFAAVGEWLKYDVSQRLGAA